MAYGLTAACGWIDTVGPLRMKKFITSEAATTAVGLGPREIWFAVRVVAKLSIGKPVYPGLAGGNDFSHIAWLRHMGGAGFNLVNSTIEHLSGSCRQAPAAS